MSVIEIFMGLMLDLAAAALIFNFVHSGRKKRISGQSYVFLHGNRFCALLLFKSVLQR